ncbi:hypothetical protein [Vibrio phage Va2]|nr:hypothetical protein [Vibrio phage Va2]
MKLLIEIPESELHKLSDYKIIERISPESERFEALRSLITRHTDVSEIRKSEQDEIIETILDALKSEDATGVAYEIELGRDSRDYRSYTYIRSYVTYDGYPDFSMKEITDHLKEKGL